MAWYEWEGKQELKQMGTKEWGRKEGKAKRGAPKPIATVTYLPGAPNAKTDPVEGNKEAGGGEEDHCLPFLKMITTPNDCEASKQAQDWPNDKNSHSTLPAPKQRLS